MASQATIRDIMGLIQRGYGDQQMSSVDRVVANSIVGYLQENGWLDPGEVAFLVEAAGREIRVDIDSVSKREHPPILLKYITTDGTEMVFRTRDEESGDADTD